MNYFDRFKNMEGNDEQGVEVNTPLVENVSFEDDKLFVEGERVFTIPFTNSTMNRINLMVVNPFEEDALDGRIYLGSGDCCHGHLYNLWVIPGYRTKKTILEKITSVDTNVFDILPIYSYNDADSVTYKNTGALVCGYGCSGAGVRLVNIDGVLADLRTIVTTEEFRSETENSTLYPYFTTKNDKIMLNNPRIDLTERLREFDIDVERTAQMSSLNYRASRF